MSKILATAALEGFIRTPGRGDPPDNTAAVQFTVRLLTTCGGVLCNNFIVEIDNTFTDEVELRGLLKTAIANTVNDCREGASFTSNDVVML